MKTKRIFSIIAAAALTLSVGAQQSMYDNYIGVGFGGGLNSMLYKPANGTQALGFGFDASLFYSRFFNRTVGLGVGLNYSWANAYTTYNFSEVSPNVVHEDNPFQSYNLKSQFNNWKERENVGTVSIPVEVLFRKELSRQWCFIAGVGASLDLPIHGAYSPKSGNYTTSGIFPKLGSYEFTNLPQHGFSTYDNTKGAKINTLAKVGGSVLADLGFRVALADHWGLYMGVNVAYGFTNLLASAQNQYLVSVNTKDPSQIDYHGTFDSKECSKAHLLRAGLKIAVDFGWGDHRKEAAEADALAASKAREDSIAAALAEQARLDSIAAAEAAALAAAKAEQARQDSIAAAEAAAKAEKARQDSIAAAEEAVRQEVRAGRAMLVVQFAAGKSVPEDSWYSHLDEGIAFLNAHPDVHLHVTGCASMDGNYQFNVQLSKKRADFIYNYLLEHGIAADRLHKEFTGPIKTSNPVEGRVAKCRYYYPDEE